MEEQDHSLKIVKKFSESRYPQRVREIGEGERRVHSLFDNGHDPEDRGLSECVNCGMPLYQEGTILRIQRTTWLAAATPEIADNNLIELNYWFRALKSKIRPITGINSNSFKFESYYIGDKDLSMANISLNKINGHERITLTADTHYDGEHKTAEFVQEVQYEERFYCRFFPNKRLIAEVLKPFC